MKSVLNKNITKCSRANTPNDCHTVNLLKVLTTDEYRPLADTCSSITNKKERQSFKLKNVPVIAISGLFKYRDESGLIQHSGLLCIDLDGVQDIKVLKVKVSALPFVAYCGKSASGTGLFAIIPIPISTPKEHKQRYTALENDFIKRFGIAGTIDPQPKNVSACRYVSYDPDGYFNHTAGTFDTLAFSGPEPLPAKSSRKCRQNATLKNLAFSDYEKVWEMIDKIQAQALDFCPDYAAYLRVAFSIANGLGEVGRAAFHAICQHNSKYNYQDADTKYNEALKNGNRVTLGTFFGMCKDYGLIQENSISQIPIYRPKRSTTTNYYADMQGVLKRYQNREITEDQFLSIQDKNHEQSGLSIQDYVRMVNHFTTN